MATGLPFMTKRFNNIFDKSLENNDLKESYLSIQISLDGFSFAVYDSRHAKYLAWSYFTLELPQKTPEKLLEALEDIYRENNLLNHAYKKVVVVHQNNLSCLVPNTYFEEAHMKTYLEHNVKVLPNDFISYDPLKNTPTNVVYIPFVNLNNFFFSKYGTFDFYHASSVVIDLLIKKHRADKEPKMFVNASGAHFEILVLKAGSLIFYNSFEAATANDFLYYTLFAMEQLNLDPETIETVLLGTLTEASEAFTLAYKYIRNLRLYSEENPKLTNAFESLPKQSNFALFHLFS
jgi:hypothetical protein